MKTYNQNIVCRQAKVNNHIADEVMTYVKDIGYNATHRMYMNRNEAGKAKLALTVHCLNRQDLVAIPH